MPSLAPGNPRMLAIDRAILAMPSLHREAVRMHYVKQRRAEIICRAVGIHHTDFSRWMFDCRAMVLNLLRRHAT